MDSLDLTLLSAWYQPSHKIYISCVVYPPRARCTTRALHKRLCFATPVLIFHNSVFTCSPVWKELPGVHHHSGYSRGENNFCVMTRSGNSFCSNRRFVKQQNNKTVPAHVTWRQKINNERERWRRKRGERRDKKLALSCSHCVIFIFLHSCPRCCTVALFFSFHDICYLRNSLLY